ncbi:MAG TPA: FtsX-like permease family protein, partial [Gemmatimonadales bacterium]|nr:FtsX-like permease family protein [Gemmatimonadales bacterium]
QPVWRVRPLESFVGDNLSGPRFVSVLTGAFSILALLLASLGLYGVTSFAVSQRTQEVGVRMALGARATQVVGMVLGRGLRIIGPAVLIGTSVALAAAQLLSTQLYGVSPADPVTFVGVPLLLVAVALLACYLPARRAARVDPLIALRTE